MQTKLHARTLHLYKTRPRGLTAAQIAAETSLNKRWLDAFGTSKFDDPGVNKVEELFVYLAGRELDCE